MQQRLPKKSARAAAISGTHLNSFAPGHAGAQPGAVIIALFPQMKRFYSRTYVLLALCAAAFVFTQAFAQAPAS